MQVIFTKFCINEDVLLPPREIFSFTCILLTFSLSFRCVHFSWFKRPIVLPANLKHYLIITRDQYVILPPKILFKGLFLPWLLLCMLLIIVMTNFNKLDNINSVLLWNIFPRWFRKLGPFNYSCLGELFKELAHSCCCMQLPSLKFKLLVHVAGSSLK